MARGAGAAERETPNTAATMSREERTRAGRILRKMLADNWTPPKDPEFVYLIRCGEFVKIGCASNPPRRMAEMQYGCPYPMTLLATLPGGMPAEKELQKRFKPYRHKGEWFRLEGEVADFVTENTPPPPEPEPDGDMRYWPWGRDKEEFDEVFGRAPDEASQR